VDEEGTLARVELRGVGKVYPGAVAAIQALDLTVEEGALYVVVGPSGSGKSTLLRLIAGLEPLSAGSLWIDGRRVDGWTPRERDLAMVFQTPVVYPHLSVAENLAFGLRARGASRGEIGPRVAETAAILGIGTLLDRRPATLSGGERQRVALGRALARRPRVFLLDEPFSSLDAPLRTALRTALGDVHRRLGTTMIHVTHDQAEAMVLGTRIAVLNQGRILQTGAPLEVYEHPASRFVGEFIGSPPMSILPAVVESETTGSALVIRIVGLPDEAAWTLEATTHCARTLLQRGLERVDLGIRAERVRVLDSAESAPLTARGAIRRLEPLGHETLATLDLGAHTLSVRLGARPALVTGALLAVALDPAGLIAFDPKSGRAL
jgi:ABC-type sugar transport system ATPase subunit